MLGSAQHLDSKQEPSPPTVQPGSGIGTTGSLDRAKSSKFGELSWGSLTTPGVALACSPALASTTLFEARAATRRPV